MALKNQQRPLWRWLVILAVLGTLMPYVSLYVRILVVSRAAAITLEDVTAFLATLFALSVEKDAFFWAAQSVPTVLLS
jgi:hypothetical protein